MDRCSTPAFSLTRWIIICPVAFISYFPFYFFSLYVPLSCLSFDLYRSTNIEMCIICKMHRQISPIGHFNQIRMNIRWKFKTHFDRFQWERLSWCDAAFVLCMAAWYYCLLHAWWTIAEAQTVDATAKRQSSTLHFNTLNECLITMYQPLKW